MLKTRILTSLILCGIIIYVLSFAPNHLYTPLLIILAMLFVFLTGIEFSALRWPKNQHKELQKYPKIHLRHIYIGLFYALFVPCVYSSLKFFSMGIQKSLTLTLGWFFLFTLSSIVLVYRKQKSIEEGVNEFFNLLSGLIYLCIPAFCLICLGHMDSYGTASRAAFIYLCIAIVFMGDTGAYFVGLKFGKRKLLKSISPKKTIEGAVGGLLFSLFGAILIKYLLHIPISLLYLSFLSIVTCLCGMIGDLLESAMKRANKAKDSGHLLPGHGGFLDRVDSLLLGMPVFYVLVSFYFQF